VNSILISSFSFSVVIRNKLFPAYTSKTTSIPYVHLTRPHPMALTALCEQE